MHFRNLEDPLVGILESVDTSLELLVFGGESVWGGKGDMKMGKKRQNLLATFQVETTASCRRTQ